MDNGSQFLAYWEDRFRAYWDGREGVSDGSHDPGHFRRVWKTARHIAGEEGGKPDLLVLLASAYFHDLVSLPKDHPGRSSSSRLSAEAAGRLLEQRWPDFPNDRIESVRHAIHAHSFSANVPPRTAEAMILQDADRLEALGAIGVARCFYTAGQMDARLFDAADPLARDREPNDRLYALDHFQVKLFRLPALMNTASGRRLAEANAAWMRGFMEKMCREIGGDYAG
ncbi:MAG TPA: HD domain-containing protein [Puia sp.]|nr:HD domain-containing protein [Puia sp.]